MGDKYQSNWIFYLPWALLGIRTSYNKDLGTSPLEMTIGKHAQLPGTILADPAELISQQDIDVDAILRKLQIKDNRVAVPPSLNKQNPLVKTLPDSVSHVYVRQHNTKGLTPPYLGPFPVISRPSRSTIGIKVGLNKNGEDRLEIRHISDVKVAHLRQDATIAVRPKRGRPPKKASLQPDLDVSENASPLLNQNNNNNGNPESSLSPNLDDDPPFHGFATAAIDFSKPPPPFPKRQNSNATHAEAWSASSKQLDEINKSINRTISPGL